MTEIPADEASWRALTDADVPPEVWTEFEAEQPDFAVLIAWRQVAFSKQSGITMPTANPENLAMFARWLGYQLARSTIDLDTRKIGRLQHLLFTNYSSKVSKLAQRGCMICSGTRPDDDLVPIHTLPIRLTPRSRQGMDSRTFRAFQAAVAAWFSRRTVVPSPTGRYCVALTFALNARARDRDLDNVVKGLQDAVTRALGVDDRHIHHLDVIKLIFPAAEEYVYLRLAPSALNEHQDVLAKIEHHSWGLGAALDLADFL